MNPSGTDQTTRIGAGRILASAGAGADIAAPVREKAVSPAQALAPPKVKLLQRVDDPSPERANRQALSDLEAGAEGLAIVFEGAPNAFGQGLPANADSLAVALRDVPLGRTHLRIDLHPHSRASVDWLVQLLAARRISPDRLDISFGIDPAGIFAGTGRLRMSVEAVLASFPPSLGHFFALGVPGILMEADGRVYHNAGATDSQEIGAMIASAVTYLRMFEEARQPVLYAAPHMGFAVAAEADFQRTRAKLATLRRLWQRLLDSYSVPEASVAIHAETSNRMLTAGDGSRNLPRGLVAAAAAITGGASSLTLLPSDLPLGLASETTRRTSLDALRVLIDEGEPPRPSTVGEDNDPLVDWLSEEAWEEVQRIEAEGGILRSIEEGRLQQRVVEARDRKVAARRSDLGMLADAPVGPDDDTDSPAAEDAAASCRKLVAYRLEELVAVPGQ